MTRLILPSAITAQSDPHWAAIASRLAIGSHGNPRVPQNPNYLFLIFANRTGSTLLCELLATTKFFPLAEESFHSDVVLPTAEALSLQSLDEVFTHIVSTKAHNGWFVSKASIGQLCMLASSGILDRILKRSRFLVIERMDKIAQVISWSIANQTGQFTSYHDRNDHIRLRYNEPVLLMDLNKLLSVDAATREFFAMNGIVPFHVCYEQLAAQPCKVGDMLLGWIGRPDLAFSPTDVGLKEQKTAINRNWAKRLLKSMSRAYSQA